MWFPRSAVVLFGATLVASCCGPEIERVRIARTADHQHVVDWLSARKHEAEHCLVIHAGLDVLEESDGARMRCQVAVGDERAVVDGNYPAFLDLTDESAWAGAIQGEIWSVARLRYVVALVDPDPRVLAAIGSAGAQPLWLRLRYANMVFVWTSDWVRVEFPSEEPTASTSNGVPEVSDG